MEGAACVCVFLAWRLQNQVAEHERREAAMGEASLNPAANESDTDEDNDTAETDDKEGGG